MAGNILTGGLWQPTWGHYEEPNKRIQGPYFLFDLQEINAGKNPLPTIRSMIQNNTNNYGDIYTHLFSSVTGNSSNNCSDKEKACPNYMKAKNAAFIWLINLDQNGNPFSSLQAREDFRIIALNILENADAPGLDNALDWFNDNLGGGGVLGPLSGPLAAIMEYNNMHYRSKELMNIIQAFDILKWSWRLDPSIPNRGSMETLARGIIEKFVQPMYIRAQWGIYPLSINNYTLVTAASMAAAGGILYLI